MTSSLPLILASASPRRRALLAAAGVACEVLPADVDESIHEDESPAFAALRIALAKAEAIAARLGADPAQSGRIIVAADTMVVLDDEVFNKPASREEARAMLTRLSGQTHTVITGLFAMRIGGPCRAEAVTAEVTFHPLTPEQIEVYISTGEADDKAGAYGLQGHGAAFIAGVEGDISCVIGLPLLRLGEMLHALTGQPPYPPSSLRAILRNAFEEMHRLPECCYAGLPE